MSYIAHNCSIIPKKEVTMAEHIIKYQQEKEERSSMDWMKLKNLDQRVENLGSRFKVVYGIQDLHCYMHATFSTSNDFFSLDHFPVKAIDFFSGNEKVAGALS